MKVIVGNLKVIKANVIIILILDRFWRSVNVLAVYVLCSYVQGVYRLARGRLSQTQHVADDGKGGALPTGPLQYLALRTATHRNISVTRHQWDASEGA